MENGESDSVHLNASHLYQYPGVYYATLNVTNVSNCNSFLTQEVNVIPSPIADFIEADVCVHRQALFTDESFDAFSKIDKWTWNLGDNSPVITTKDPFHVYANPGKFNVSLTVTDSNSCSSTFTKVVNADSLPVANFIANTVCQGLITSFTDQSKAHGSPLFTWQWNFNDGAFAFVPDPQHLFPNAGVHDSISLIVTDQNGCSDTVMNKVIIDSLPVINFVSNITCLGNATIFTLKSQISNLKSFIWDFGDGATDAVNLNATHQYNLPGVYFATLTVTNANNCSSSLTEKVNVIKVPVADFIGTNVCQHLQTSFTDQSFSTSSELDKWTWNFGDGIKDIIFLKDSIPNHHTYANPGRYNVSLTVTDTNLCTNTITKTIIVDSLPAADFISDSVCQGLITTFKDKSKPHGSPLWKPGNGILMTALLHLHKFRIIYSRIFGANDSVRLIVTESEHVRDTIYKNVIINALPAPGFYK